MPKKTLGFCAALAPLCVPASATAATCASGYYLSGGTCQQCDLPNPNYYCPGDDNRYECPKTTLDLEHFSYYWFWSPNGLQESKEGCRVQWTYPTFTFSCGYNTKGYESTNEANTHCMATVLSCPAGYWCQNCNENGNYWNWSHETMVNGQKCYPVGRGYYSPDGAITRTACPNGTSTVSTTATSADECVPLCTAGVTHIHAGTASAPLFATRHTTPALVVRTSGGLCYGNLTPGAGPGINIRMGGTTYRME